MQGMSQRAQTLSACIFLEKVLCEAHLLQTPSEGADYLETEMQIWALAKNGTSQRAQIWSACIFLDCVWFYTVHVPLAPSEGAVYLVTKMQVWA